MKDYKSYTMQDFALDEDFCRWVRQKQPKDEAFWQRFIRENESKLGEIDSARLLIKATHVKEEALTAREIRQEVEKFLANAQIQEAEQAVEQKRSFVVNLNRGTVRTWLAAAIVLITVGVFVFNQYGKTWLNETAAREPKLVETTNFSRQPMKLTLSDSSRIVLQPGSRLRYPQHFSPDERRVYLSGEANFAVKKSKAAFIIISGQMVTKVLGTQFTVRAYENDQQNRVQVQSGKVSVYSLNNRNDDHSRQVKGLILTANQEAIFEKKQNELSKTLVVKPEKIEKTVATSEVEYREVPLPAVLHNLGKAYGIPVQFDEQRLKACKITATFTTEPFYEQLDQLCKIASVSYEIVDGQIIVSGKGCD